MVGILSDSHDNLTKVRLAVKLFNDTGCDLVIHAGDIVAPFTIQELKSVRCPIKAVFGNCNGEKPGLVTAFEGVGEIREAPFEFSHAGKRFLVTHLDGPISDYLAKKPCDVLIYGHTHKPVVEMRGTTLVINPGEAGGWLSGKSTVALFDPERMTADIIPLD